MNSTQGFNIIAIDDGAVLKTNYGIKAFKLFGRYYTTNKNRKKRYSFDDRSWRYTRHGLLWRIWKVLKREAYVLR